MKKAPERGAFCFPVDLILSLSKDEVVAGAIIGARPSWFDRLTMRSTLYSLRPA